MAVRSAWALVDVSDGLLCAIDQARWDEMTAAVARRQPRIEDRGIAGGVLKNEQQVKIEADQSHARVSTCTID